MKKVTVVGGGLVGALLAAIFAKKGYAVEVFERRPDIREAEISAGKSINLALSDRGWKALDIVGASAAIRPIAIPMYGREVHDVQGNTNFQPYGKADQAIYSVSRGELNARLLDFASQSENVNLHFNWKCTEVDFEENISFFENSETGEKRQVKSDLIFGSDGAFSSVRYAMQKTRRFDYSQKFLQHGYRELLLPAGPDNGFLLNKNALHIWPRQDYMLIALPNLDGSFTCTLFMPYEGPVSFQKLNSDEKIRTFFKENFPDFEQLMPDVAANFNRHPLSDMVIVHCYPWRHQSTALIGDAAHALVPFYGQGMNAGFEDCSLLAELMEQHEDWDQILDKYQMSRKPDADAISELALRNYVEMRDLVADPEFLLRKKIEAKLYKKHPDKWMPLYSQVTFSHIRYSTALATGKKQDAIMRDIMQKPEIEKIWDSPEVEAEILARL